MIASYHDRMICPLRWGREDNRPIPESAPVPARRQAEPRQGPAAAESVAAAGAA